MSNEQKRWNKLKVLCEKGDWLLTNHLFTLKPIDFLIKEIVGREIRLSTDSRWGHIVQYKGKQKVFDALYPKVRINPLDRYAPKWYSKYEVAVIRLNNLTTDQVQAMMSFWYKILGSEYDVPQLAGIKINTVYNHLDYPTALNDIDKFICIEAVYRAAKYARVRDIDLKDIHPDNYAPCLAVELVKRGRARLISHFVPNGFHKKIQVGNLED